MNECVDGTLGDRAGGESLWKTGGDWKNQEGRRGGMRQVDVDC